MASMKSGPKDRRRAGKADAEWRKLTWEDLDRWAGSSAVSRGRTYQRGGRVKDMKVSVDGDLLATVNGGERYATTVALTPGNKLTHLESSCTCPVGVSCKHAVALVAEYLAALADGRDVPIAEADDPRWAKIEGDGEVDFDEDDEDWDEDEEPVRKTRSPRSTASQGKAGAVDWNAKIEAEIRGKSRDELADLVWVLTRRYPQLYREFRERIALREGAVGPLVAEARREIKKITSEPAWSNHWDGEGHIPDYSRIKNRFERLLELGHADEVVELGREFVNDGLSQVAESHDEGETAERFAECLAVVFRAVTKSSLSRPDQLLFAIDAELDDDYEAIGDTSTEVWDAATTPEEWSELADRLADRLKAEAGAAKAGADSFSRSYRRNSVSGYLADALENAGRASEIRALYEAEARITGSYERIVRFLLEKEDFDGAERWAREGIAATTETYAGIAKGLADRLCEIARNRKQWDVVAAHAAQEFFTDHPGPTSFDELMKAARKAKVEEPVRLAALRFLETGVMPYRASSPPKPAAKAPVKNFPAKRRSPASPQPPPAKPEPPKPARLTIDPSWPLPVPDYLIPTITRPRPYDPGPRPHLDVLLQMAIIAKQPDGILRWYDKMRAESKGPGAHYSGLGYSNQVAEAVATTHPERALEIYRAALNSHLPRPDQTSYHSSGEYLRKLRPIYDALGRSAEWTALLASIREQYRNRPRFMEVLDGVDGRPIVASARPKRK